MKKMNLLLLAFGAIALGAYWHHQDTLMESSKVRERDEFVKTVCHGYIRKVEKHSRKEWLLVVENCSDHIWKEFWLLDRRFPDYNGIICGDSISKNSNSKDIFFYRVDGSGNNKQIAVYHYTQ
jgi:hypothetical protein